MSAFKCQQCGEELEFEKGASVCECPACFSKQTLPKTITDDVSRLYDRAEHFRTANDFDRALDIYEKIIEIDPSDAEAHWSYAICKYGIEYVVDGSTGKRIPTVHRVSYVSILNDPDYKLAVDNADEQQRAVYEEKAAVIDGIQKNYLRISANEKPYDVFICYKESASDGERTKDSVLAQEIYDELAKQNINTFFSRITLEDKLGQAYEPYIFAALNSAKVMLCVGTKQEYFNAPWVKNEWSRFLNLIKEDSTKNLIPVYRDMDPYDMPDEFSALQAQDMSKIGAIQDLVRGVKKLIGGNAPVKTEKEETIGNFLDRANNFLGDYNWAKANEYCEKVLDKDPTNADAYLIKLLAGYRVCKVEALVNMPAPIGNNVAYKNYEKFSSDAAMKKKLFDINDKLVQRSIQQNYANDQALRESIYAPNVAKFRKLKSKPELLALKASFESLGDYKDSALWAEKCVQKIKAQSIKGLIIWLIILAALAGGGFYLYSQGMLDGILEIFRK